MAWVSLRDASEAVREEGKGRVHTRGEMEGLGQGAQCLFCPRIVEEVRSILYNQEQEKELLHRHASKALSLQSGSSLDMREVATQQDLISALVSREKVRIPFPT